MRFNIGQFPHSCLQIATTHSQLFAIKTVRKMAQKSIASFFKPIHESKRKLIEGEVSTPKKLKESGDEETKISKLSSVEKNQVKVYDSVAIKSQIEKANKVTPILPLNIGQSWFTVLKDEFSKPYFIKLNKFVMDERKSYTIFPPPNEVFSWTQYCSMDEVKVIIIGQDPYHGLSQAHGIAFSVKKGVSLPPSLTNIFKEVKNCYPEFEPPNHGELIGWAQQGVLMLNACLTVRQANANSHANKGWEQFTDAVIKQLATKWQNRVFLLWGSYAQKKCSFIDQKKHLVLKSVHPSPLSAHRGFFNSGHFKCANNYLIQNGLKPIDWTKL